MTSTDRPEASPLTIALASAFFFGMLVLGIPAFASFFAVPVPAATGLPTAIIAITPSPTDGPLDVIVSSSTDPTPMAPDDLDKLPATLPAGATAEDQSLTIYQGWLWRFTGTRAGDRCLLEVWPDDGAMEQFWIVCVLLDL